MISLIKKKLMLNNSFTRKIFYQIKKLKNFLNNFKYKNEISRLYKENFIWSAQIGISDDSGVKKGLAMSETIINSINNAFKINLQYNKNKLDTKYFNIFPGEHYRFLAGLIEYEKPNQIIDIGTSSGMSSRIMLDYSTKNSKTTTFDLIKWDLFDSHLSKDDFKNGRLTQYLDDLSDIESFNKHLSLIDAADLIFLDAPKDGDFEYAFIKNLAKSKLSVKKRFLVLDDIKFLNMIKLWKCIKSPKFDVTSFGHISGTGIVDISSNIEVDPLAFK